MKAQRRGQTERLAKPDATAGKRERVLPEWSIARVAVGIYLARTLQEALLGLAQSPFRSREEVPEVSAQDTPFNRHILTQCKEFHKFVPAPWAPGAISQTVLGLLVNSGSVEYQRRDIVEAPDGVEIIVDWKEQADLAEDTPIMLILHGIGGGSESRLARCLADEVKRHGWRAAVYNRRGHGQSSLLPGRLAPTHPPRAIERRNSGLSGFAKPLMMLREAIPRVTVAAAAVRELLTPLANGTRSGRAGSPSIAIKAVSTAAELSPDAGPTTTTTTTVEGTNDAATGAVTVVTSGDDQESQAAVAAVAVEASGATATGAAVAVMDCDQQSGSTTTTGDAATSNQPCAETSTAVAAVTSAQADGGCTAVPEDAGQGIVMQAAATEAAAAARAAPWRRPLLRKRSSGHEVAPDADGAVPRKVQCTETLQQVKKIFPRHTDTDDLAQVIDFIHASFPLAPIVALGFSQGSNGLVHYLGTHHKQQAAGAPNQEPDNSNSGGDEPCQKTTPLTAAMSVSNAYDITEGVQHLCRDWVTDAVVTRPIKRLLKKELNAVTTLLEAHGLNQVDVSRALAAHSIRDFDEALVVPAYGFSCLEEYYTSHSCKEHLKDVHIPLLLMNNKDDPIISAELTDIAKQASQQNPNIISLCTQTGGHLGWLQDWRGDAWLNDVMMSFAKAAVEAVGRGLPRQPTQQPPALITRLPLADPEEVVVDGIMPLKGRASALSCCFGSAALPASPA